MGCNLWMQLSRLTSSSWKLEDDNGHSIKARPSYRLLSATTEIRSWRLWVTGPMQREEGGCLALHSLLIFIKFARYFSDGVGAPDSFESDFFGGSRTSQRF